MRRWSWRWITGFWSVLLGGCFSQPTVEMVTSQNTQNPLTLAPSPGPASRLGLSITPHAGEVIIGDSIQLTPSGGAPPYRLVLLSGEGVLSDTGTFKASATTGAVKIQVIDSAQNSAMTQIQVVLPGRRIPNDPLFSTQYGLDSSSDQDLDAPESWNIRTDCSSVAVGVIDTGIDVSHPDLVENLWTNPGETPDNGVDDDGNGLVDDIHGWNFIANNSNPSDEHYHGTHVAGIIGAVGNNGVGVSGVCWKAKLVALKAGDANGALPHSAILGAIQYAINKNIKVLNNSYGSTNQSATMLNKITEAKNAGILFLAAAGNDSRDNDATPYFPATYLNSDPQTNVVAVASTTSSGSLSSFSNFGASSVHLAAPGSSIRSTTPTSATNAMTQRSTPLATSYANLSGTSMATPMVAGAAALVWAEHPQLSMSEVRERLLVHADRRPALENKVKDTAQLNLFRMLRTFYPR